ncbi:hypothetical protein [Herbaspirillum sp. VT-16-41]|uniref:hypothetical protein n=1 Tax=Herbaspirillum sp. VT-16-41 TaxID=1953765 RepID=UPI000981BA02|nr:hypothetical protein [Herbaspirillum sp. VT-16-41]ONN66826.1 hypothetical protein BTM36_09825 [Herbaspirillum sp. VT-16-41]
MKRASLSTHPAHWPRPARLALYLLTTLACAASGLLLAVEELDESRQSAQRQQQDLRVQYQSALNQLALRDGLQSRQTALEMQLVAQQVQLWRPDQQQPELLHAKLARRAEEHGLVLTSFQPQPGKLSATISLRGKHAGLLRFVEQVSRPPMPVLFENLEITSERGTQAALLMKATVSAPTGNAKSASMESPP